MGNFKKYMLLRFIVSRIRYLLVVMLVVSSGHALAIPEPAPPPNTMQILCSSGTCHTDDINNNSTLFNTPNGTSILHSPLIGITISNACITMEERNITSHCLTYPELAKFEKVNSLLAGKWISVPYPHKIYPTFKGVWNYYTGPNIVMIDPPSDFLMRAKNIIIQDDGFVRTDANDNITNTQLVQHLNRFVDGSCLIAQVAPILSLINDTIQYMQSDCSITHYNDTEKIQRVDIPFDLNSYNVKQIDYMHNFNNHTRMNDCIHFKCQLQKDPWHNHDSKFGW